MVGRGTTVSSLWSCKFIQKEALPESVTLWLSFVLHDIENEHFYLLYLDFMDLKVGKIYHKNGLFLLSK